MGQLLYFQFTHEFQTIVRQRPDKDIFYEVALMLVQQDENRNYGDNADKGGCTDEDGKYLNKR